MTHGKIYKTNIIPEKIVKVVIGPDHCKILFDIIEPLESQIRLNYSRNIFIFAKKLYLKEALDEAGTHIRG